MKATPTTSKKAFFVLSYVLNSSIFFGYKAIPQEKTPNTKPTSDCEVLFRNRALATNARVTWGDFGKARVVGFPPARQMEMEAQPHGVADGCVFLYVPGLRLWAFNEEV